MRYWATALAALALAASPRAQATVIGFTSVLSGSAESPPNSSPGTGSTVVTFDTVANTMRVQIAFSGLLGSTTASHIHCCTATPFTGTAGVATVTPTFTGFPLGVTSGTYDNTFDLTLAASWNAPFIAANGGTPLAAEAALLAGVEAGRAYLNIHTTVVPGGEIRGFLVPEPASVTLLVTGLLAAGTRMRRRRR